MSEGTHHKICSCFATKISHFCLDLYLSQTQMLLQWKAHFKLHCFFHILLFGQRLYKEVCNLDGSVVMEQHRTSSLRVLTRTCHANSVHDSSPSGLHIPCRHLGSVLVSVLLLRALWVKSNIALLLCTIGNKFKKKYLLGV